tara:strand:- start:1161 stop:1358 length:198 start_codon:yes stop_codon:yes gene_type:complete
LPDQSGLIGIVIFWNDLQTTNETQTNQETKQIKNQTKQTGFVFAPVIPGQTPARCTQTKTDIYTL